MAVAAKMGPTCKEKTRKRACGVMWLVGVIEEIFCWKHRDPHAERR